MAKKDPLRTSVPVRMLMSSDVLLWATDALLTVGFVPISACIRLYHGKTALILSGMPNAVIFDDENPV